MSVERVQQGLAVTVYADFLRDGVGENPSPDSATVTVTRGSTGTVLYTDAAAVDIDDPAGRFGFTLSPTDTALLDTLTLDWTVTFDDVEQTARTVVEVVGGFLFSVAEARALPPLNNTATYSTDRILEYRTLAEQTIEDLCERAFVPRYRQETLDGSGTNGLMLSRPDLRSIRSVATTSAGVSTPYSVDDIALLALNPSGIVHSYGATWASGYSNITVGYEHGTDHPPARIKQAALLLARSWLVKGPIDDRATGQVVGDVSFGLVVPGRNGSYTGLPEVDAAIDQYSLHTGVA
jgi:hypothetical protein